MDSHTLELLEFDRIRILVSSYAGSPLGREAARRMEPLSEAGEIRHEQSLTTEMVDALVSRLGPPLAGLLDIRPYARRAAVGSSLTADELAEVSSVLKAIGEADRWLARIGDQFPRLGGLRSGVGEFSGLANTIGTCLDDRGKILDSASRRLAEVRQAIQQAEERIQDTLRRMIRSPEIRRYLRYPNFTLVGHHYVLPVGKDHRGEIAGSVHRTSATNETVYIEPQAIAEQSAQLSFHRAREAKEIQRILRWLSAQVGQVSDSLVSTLDALSHLDLAYARGRFSLDFRMSPPDLNESGRFVLRGARHPILEQLFREEARRPAAPVVEKESAAEPESAREAPTPPEPAVEPEAPPTTPAEPKAPPAVLRGFDLPPVAAPSPPDQAVSPPAPAVVEPPPRPVPETPVPPKEVSSRPVRKVTPIDVHLGLQFNILVVTGPNTGGKTVALKTVGLLAIMAQCGLHIPAHQGSQLSIVDDVLADIGDEQSLEQSLSTFSSHIRRITDIVGKATDRSLVLLDEMGAGTDPAEGAALGRSILDELDALGCRAMVTTHIGDLKTYAFSNARAENAAVEFDIDTLRPLYRLHIGDIGQSNALQIAQRLNLPQHLIDRASKYLNQSSGEESPEWQIIAKLRKEAEDAHRAALAEKAETERAREALNARLADLQTQAEHDARIEEARARLQPGDRVVVPRFGYDRPGRVVKIDPRKNTATVAIGAMKWDVPVAELIPQLITTPGAPPEPPKPKAGASRGPARPDDPHR